ncbi:hypothetical protein WJX73_006434 [Symbiochloris irregularis]|uniref:Uricase n=1 Tax=Symbiochloris irregularis TaxID=706552 RepID=A0AAW1PDP8_9CHLO
MAAYLAQHQHGKLRVRLGRTWREGNTHYFSEWNVSTTLVSDMAHAFKTSSNADMTATDTQKNTVYFVAKQCSQRCSPEEYGVALARHFVKTYPKVSKTMVSIEATPWTRVSVAGQAHSHGFTVGGTELRTVYAAVDEAGKVEVVSGFKGLKVLKTTQSGYEDFLKDKYTILKDTKERIVATSITASWRYSGSVAYDAAYETTKSALSDAFFGPAQTGVYSPSVQYTLFQMAKEALKRTPQLDSIFLNMPNIHFIPCNPVTSKFEDDVYVATSEPSGNIEATITRAQVQPHAKL